MGRGRIGYSFEEIKRKAEDNNFILTNNYYEFKPKITIIDKEGYLFSLKFYEINMNYSHSIVDQHNPNSIHNIKLWLEKNNKNFMLVSESYISAESNLLWECKTCGHQFLSNWITIKNGKRVFCPVCKRNKIQEIDSFYDMYPELLKQWSDKNIGTSPLDINQISMSRSIWCCEQGHEWVADVVRRIKEKSKCPYCLGCIPSETNNLAVDNPSLSEEWDYIKNKLSPKDYTPRSSKKVWWICKKCNHNWDAAITNRHGLKSGCPKCHVSKGENKLKVFLEENKINFIEQKRFDSLKGINNGYLSYDFYLPDFNLLIEYQGQRHDGNGNYYMKQNLPRQQEHDSRKRTYAVQNNMQLLEIWYYDFDRIEEILSEALSLPIS